MLVMVMGCSNEKQVTLKTSSNEDVALVVIDGCEYLTAVTYGGAATYCHKGNCTNSIHIYKKETKNEKRKK